MSLLRWLLLAIIVVCNSLGDVLNTAGMKRWGELDELTPSALGHMVLAIFRNPLVMAGLGTLAISFFALLALLSFANVSFAIPTTAASFLFETLLAKIYLREDVSWRRWAGASLVACGVLLLSL
jgi:drug/metabolite transporter (DMT)-like permease